MKIYLGADHRGFELKEKIKTWLEKENYQVIDVGAQKFDPEDDYVDFALKAIKGVRDNGEGERAILFCGSGHGMELVANRFHSARAILGFNKQVVVQGRAHEDANVLSLPAEWLEDSEAIEMVELFLTTDFTGKNKYKRRLAKITEIKD